jgi:hypothetical protein
MHLNSIQKACLTRENAKLAGKYLIAKHRAYISRREVKVFGVKIFLYEWALTRKILSGQGITKMKIIYFSKRPPFSVC